MFIILTFKGPRIVIYSYNNNQQDALFLNFILVRNSKRFGQIYCPSSGVIILYSQQVVIVILVMLTASEVSSILISQAANITYLLTHSLHGAKSFLRS